MTPMPDKRTILIVDDEKNTREGLRLAFEDDYRILLAEDAFRAMELLKENNVDLILTDMRMPGMDGLDFIRHVTASEPHPLIIMLTAYGSVQTAIEAMKLGAYDYVSKPVDLDNLETMIRKGLESAYPQKESDSSEKVLDSIIASSKEMQKVMSRVRQVADTSATVLLTGESGTGKEVLANAIHALSPRKNAPFIPVHCAALNENLLESELVGHEKGAYTGASERVAGRFETAAGGTLFLDEIGEISLPVQVKLLRVLETKTFERVGGKAPISVDVRLIAATNRNLAEMVSKGTFREDLYYRLNVINIAIPPLRERRSDIPNLLQFFLRKNQDAQHKGISDFSRETIDLLTTYDWPGNVRELRNCVENMAVFAHGSKLTIGDVPADIQERLERQLQEKPATPSAPSELDIRSNEKALIEKALEECGGNRSRAAEKLNISRRTLQRKIKLFGLE